jgi:hypothetical protein
MREDPSGIISEFLKQLESHNVTSILLKQFLIALNVLPLDLPLLQGIGSFFSGESNNFVTRKMESRYRRIAFVQHSLENIDFSKAKPENRFEDFIFAQSDFSIYEKIDAESFQLLYIDGLEDLSDDFYTKVLSREKFEIQKIISARYKLIDGFFVSDGNPFLIPIMRSVHTSIDFASFPDPNQFRNEFETLLDFLQKNAGLPDIFFQHFAQEEDDLFCDLLVLFDKTEVSHNNETKSRFFIAEEKGKTALFIVFNPGGKAFTKLSAVSNVPYGEHSSK